MASAGFARCLNHIGKDVFCLVADLDPPVRIHIYPVYQQVGQPLRQAVSGGKFPHDQIALYLFLMLGLFFLGLCDNGGIDVFCSQDQRCLLYTSDAADE